jgi:predicted metalloprotease with PDZ domain
MMNGRLSLLLAAPLLLAAAPPRPIDYLVAPQMGAHGLDHILVRLRLRGDADGETEIALPNRWAGTERLHEAVRGFAVAGGRLVPGGDPALRRIRHRPGAALVISYSFGLGDADPGADYEKARPVVRPGWFYLHGEGTLAAPVGRGKAPARLRWGPAPAGWRFVSSLESLPAATVDEAAQAILIGGNDLRVVARTVGGRPVRLALRGDWPFADAVLADGLARAIAAENRYLASPAIPFLVTLVPLTGGDTGALSLGGTGRTGGFALAATTNATLDDFLPLLAHEYGHRWFGRALGPVPDPDGPDYWFTEGFNDFVSRQALVHAGLWSPTDYAGAINALLLRYASSSARVRPMAELMTHFWDDNDAQQMPYDRGHLFALLLDGGDGRVRQALLAMLAGPAAFPAAETEAQRFARAAGLAPARVAAMLAGEPIALPADLFARCGRLEWAEQPIYATGYTSEERAGGRYFATVEEGGPAWRAGLRPGMRYLRRISFRFGDAGVPIVMRVADEAGERELRWLPEGRERVRFQRLVLADAGAACGARLGGG